MTKAQMNLQDTFLNQARKENVGVTIYLVNSVQLRGNVRGFDAFTILLETPGKAPQLVYKHAVTSVVPMRPMQNLQAELTREHSAHGHSNGPRPHPTHADSAAANLPPTTVPVPDVPPAADVEPIS